MDAIFDSYREYIENPPALADAPDWKREFLIENTLLGKIKDVNNHSEKIKIYFGDWDNTNNEYCDVVKLEVEWNKDDNKENNLNNTQQEEYNREIHIKNFEQILSKLNQYTNFYFRVDKRGYLDIPNLDRYKRRHITFNIINYLYHKEKSYKFDKDSQGHFTDYTDNRTIEMCNKAYHLNGNNVFHVFEYLDDEWYEEQEGLGCGRHALNNLLRGKFFIKSRVKELHYGHLDKLYFPVDLNIICNKVNEIKNPFKIPKRPTLGIFDTASSPPNYIGCPDSEDYEINLLWHALRFLANFEMLGDHELLDMKFKDFRKLYSRIENVSVMENIQGILLRYPSHYVCILRNGWYYDSLDKTEKLGPRVKIPIKELEGIKLLFKHYQEINLYFNIKAFAFKRSFNYRGDNPLVEFIATELVPPPMADEGEAQPAEKAVATTAVKNLETITITIDK